MLYSVETPPTLRLFTARICIAVLVVYLITGSDPTPGVSEPLRAYASFVLTGDATHTDEYVPRRFEFVEPDKFSGQSVYAILQDRLGALWLGANDGLYRYDGHLVMHAREIDHPGTLGGGFPVYGLYEDEQDHIWILGRKGVSYWDGEAQQFRHWDALTNLQVFDVASKEDGHYWLGTDQGLWKFDILQNDLMKVSTPHVSTNAQQSPSIHTVFVDSKERLWAGSPGRLYSLDISGEELGEMFVMDLPTGIRSVSFIAEDAPGRIWVGTAGAGLLCYDDGEGCPEDFEGVDSLPSRWLSSMVVGKDGHFVIGTEDVGFFQWDPLELKVTGVPEANVGYRHVPAGAVLSLLYDQSGILWAASTNGLIKERDRVILTTTPAHGNGKGLHSLDIRGVNAVAYMDDEHLWLGTQTDGIFYVDMATGETGQYQYEQGNPQSLLDNRVLALAGDGMGSVWIATSKGISRVDPSHTGVTNYPISDGRTGFTGKEIFQKLFVSSTDDLWVAASFGGMYTYDREQDAFTRWVPPGDPLNASKFVNIVDVHEDGQGRLWFAASLEGLLLYDPSLDIANSPGDRLVQLLAEEEVVAVTGQVNGDVWAGTKNKGVFSIRAGSSPVLHPLKEDRLGSSEVVCMVNGPQGGIWVLTRAGVTRIDPDHSEQATLDDRNGINGAVFYNNACMRDNKGTLYMGSDQGLFYFNSENSHSLSTPFSAFMSMYQKDGRVFLPPRNEERITLMPHEESIRFHFGVTDFLMPKETTFRYRFSGYDSEWTVLSGENQVTFSNLKPGNYQLVIQGANHEGIWSLPQSYTVSVPAFAWRPSLWNTGAIAFIGIMMLGGFVWIYRLRAKNQSLEQQLIDKADEADALSSRFAEQARAQIAMDLHDDLGADLTRLVMSLERRLQREDLSDYSRNWTRECWDYAQRITQELRHLTWVLDAERDWLTDLVDRLGREADSTFSADQVTFDMDKIPRIPVSSSFRKDVILWYREALTNIARHAQASEVYITVHYHKGFLEIVVHDDGVGFDVDSVIAGNGLPNMKKRAQNLNAELSWSQPPGGGTRVALRVAVV